jgi:A118 family predicted phage portal protein|nr:MAG TPA: portal protein [Caudoviricetes sp.]
MEQCVKNFLQKKGYTVNDKAMTVIQACDDWYSNRVIEDFHKRKTLNAIPYELSRLNFGKRCCSDDANLCEVLEINAGDGEQGNFVNGVLNKSEFNTQYRKQLEKTSADGTTACYIRLDNATFMDNNSVKGGTIKLNYVEADAFMPLTVENDIVIEAAFSGSGLSKGKKQTTLVLFTLGDNGLYTAETHVFDDKGNELTEQETIVQLGEVKPFAVMRNAEVNNLDDMTGYGLPKLWDAIPALKVVDLCYNVLFSDLDKAEKIILINELLCEFDNDGKPKLTTEQKKLFVFTGEKLPEEKGMIQEYNPEIRIEPVTKSFELALSLLSMSFGYGTKKYSFENGQITTATEYVGERQDQMQELNRQRQEAIRYIQDICRAVMWFANTFQGKAFNLDQEILVDFDDSYITDREAELERKRNDALAFDIPELTVWYLRDAYSLAEEEARKLVEAKVEKEEQETGGEDED